MLIQHKSTKHLTTINNNKNKYWFQTLHRLFNSTAPQIQVDFVMRKIILSHSKRNRDERIATMDLSAFARNSARLASAGGSTTIPLPPCGGGFLQPLLWSVIITNAN